MGNTAKTPHEKALARIRSARYYKKFPKECYSRNARIRKRGDGSWPLSVFEEQWALQGGLCIICGRQMTKNGNTKNAAQADHDHKTGIRRGIPCMKCNRGLGLFEDNPTALRTAAVYLETDHEAIRQSAKLSLVG